VRHTASDFDDNSMNKERNMPKLSLDNIMSLEEYSRVRDSFRVAIMEHKKKRRVHLDENATLCFEDFLTMKYQLHEILRTERIDDADTIKEELEAYNSLIPDGHNWKATFMLEYPDVDERRRRLAELVGVEDRVHVRIAGFDPIYAIANEDLERETEEKTSSVDFLRFEFPATSIKALNDNTDITLWLGVDHPGLHKEKQIVNPVRDPLLRVLCIN